MTSDPVTGPAASNQAHRLRQELTRAVIDLNSLRANNALDELFASLSIERALSEAIVPCFEDLVRREASGQPRPAEDRFGTELLERRLLAQASGWEHGRGPRALLVAAPEDRSRLMLIACGLVLRSNGWRITFLPASAAAASAASRSEPPPQLIVLAGPTEQIDRIESELSAFTGVRRVALGEREAERRLMTRGGTTILSSDPVDAAYQIVDPGPSVPPAIQS